MVSALDEAVGHITDALEKRGFMNNTLIVFTTDASIYAQVNPFVILFSVQESCPST